MLYTVTNRCRPANQPSSRHPAASPFVILRPAFLAFAPVDDETDLNSLTYEIKSKR